MGYATYVARLHQAETLTYEGVVGVGVECYGGVAGVDVVARTE